jgi:hypothetical protein
MGSRKTFTPFAVMFDEKLGCDVDFIDCRYSGIHPFVQVCDGMPKTFFSDRPTRAYFTVQQVIEWHEKEIRETKGKSGNQKIIDVLKKINDQPIVEQ